MVLPDLRSDLDRVSRRRAVHPRGLGPLPSRSLRGHAVAGEGPTHARAYGFKRRSDGHASLRREAQCAFKDSMIHKFCDSHYISRFAAFFIDARAKRSFVESFDLHQSVRHGLPHKRRPLGPKARLLIHGGGRVEDHEGRSRMIPPQVHLRRPCYDFYFL